MYRGQQVADACSPLPPSVEKANVAPVSPVILTFDVEEHHRIEAAIGLKIDAEQKEYYGRRLEHSTQWLLDTLERTATKATFFVVGEAAKKNPNMVRAISARGHEIASHGWDHQRIHNFTPRSFRSDVLRSMITLEQITGMPVLGYRAPTFSLMPQTAWAVDVLAELGFAYDSSIYPVRHDRYGVPRAPRSPFYARGNSRCILELPPATLSIFGVRVPMGGGGYFRLFPLFLTKLAIRQLRREKTPNASNLYFHPWEFDPDQSRLPMGRLSRFRTYVGIRRTQRRLERLLKTGTFCRAIDMARNLLASNQELSSYDVARREPEMAAV